MAGHRDLRAYLDHLRENDLLFTVGRKVNKDTELMPLVRWQFRGLPESGRKGFLFDNVTDLKGRTYKGKLAVAIIGASRRVYAAALGCDESEIKTTWQRAMNNPIPPREVDPAAAPVKEEVHFLDGQPGDGQGLEEFPIPISTPGFDPGPFITAPLVFSKHPETGEGNIGTYRGMVKGRDKSGIFFSDAQHITVHWRKAQELGRPLEAAIVIGAPPAVAMASVSKIPYHLEEIAVAGGLLGAPIDVVKCETVDLYVPATAEIVLEGEIDTQVVEPEGPFGEWAGYMGLRGYRANFKIKCITHRKDPIFHAFISQFPPSESSMIRGMANESTSYKFLKEDAGLQCVKDVAFHHAGGCNEYCVIQMKDPKPWEVWRALNAASALHCMAKIVVAVNDDIDPRDADSVNWALSTRLRPHADLQVNKGKTTLSGVCCAPPEADVPEPRVTSSLLLDATLKWSYPPVSLPKREFMEHARTIWEAEGLPSLSPKVPWFGYSLGLWPSQFDVEAQRALNGEFMETVAELKDNAAPADHLGKPAN